MEFAPLLTAYSVLPSRESVTAKVAAPVYLRLGSMPAGARASILVRTLLVDVSMAATWSALSCATYSLDCDSSSVIPRAFPSNLMRWIRWPARGEESRPPRPHGRDRTTHTRCRCLS